MEKPKLTIKNLIRISLIVLILGLISGEVLLRFLYYNTRKKAQQNSIWIKSDDPILIYKNRPNYIKEGIKYTDQNGILTPSEISKEKSPNVSRIIILGDSIGAAYYIPFEYRFSSILEGLLNKFNIRKKYEVLNFSINGYKTLQEARLLKTHAINFNPDLIIIQYCLNDVENAMTPTMWFTDDVPKILLSALLTEKFILRYGTPEYWANLYNSPKWETVIQGLRIIKNISEDKNIPVVIVVFPFFMNWENYPDIVTFMHENIAKTVKDFNFNLLDLKNIYSQYDVKRLKNKKNDIYHPSLFGNKIAGETIYNYLINKGLIK